MCCPIFIPPGIKRLVRPIRTKPLPPPACPAVDYNEPSDYWLVEISGVPFGLFREMLPFGVAVEQNATPWRRMLYGMSFRIHRDQNPASLWRFWDQFGIQDARMIGYWDEACPVQTGRPDVLATAFVRADKTLIALATCAQSRVTVRLAIQETAVGLGLSRARLFAPAIPGMQDEFRFPPTDEIPLAPGQGWLLVLEPDPSPAN
jgi:hypothetical protein